MFSALGLAIAGSILLWVYAGFSPRNTPIIEYKGGIEIGINTLNNFSEKKEIHKYRFSGTKGQIIDINVVLESDIRFGTKFYIDNPEQMFEVLSNTTTANTNFSASQKEEIYQEFLGTNPKQTFWHGHSFTANPLGCAAANASLDLLEQSPKCMSLLRLGIDLILRLFLLNL